VSSTWRIAQFWGLVPQREEAPAPAPRAEAAASRKAPKAKPAAARKRRATARAKLLPGFDPGLGLRLALAPMAAFRRMLRGRRRR
jgi:hypothetical protein